jgi:hypothetical protein
MNKPTFFLCGLVALQCASDTETRILKMPISSPTLDYVEMFPNSELDGDSKHDYTQIDYSNSKIRQKIQKGVFEEEFLSNLEKMCIRLDMHAMAALSVIDYETGGTFKPGRQNKYGATGLIQFTPQTAKELATTTKHLAKMSQSEQLLYVEEFFKTRKIKPDYSNPRNVALAVFWPRAVGRKDEDILFSKKNNKNAYKGNEKLDLNKDGHITVGEYLFQALQRGYLTNS